MIIITIVILCFLVQIFAFSCKNSLLNEQKNEQNASVNGNLNGHLTGIDYRSADAPANTVILTVELPRWLAKDTKLYGEVSKGSTNAMVTAQFAWGPGIGDRSCIGQLGNPDTIRWHGHRGLV